MKSKSEESRSEIDQNKVWAEMMEFDNEYYLDFLSDDAQELPFPIGQPVLFGSARMLLKETSTAAHRAQRLLRKLCARHLHGSSRLLMQAKFSHAKLSLAKGMASGSKRQAD